MDFDVKVRLTERGTYRASTTIEGKTYNGEARTPGWALIELGDFIHANMRQRKSDIQTLAEIILE